MLTVVNGKSESITIKNENTIIADSMATPRRSDRHLRISTLRVHIPSRRSYDSSIHSISQIYILTIRLDKTLYDLLVNQTRISGLDKVRHNRFYIGVSGFPESLLVS